jgi:hypothetical protein
MQTQFSLLKQTVLDIVKVHMERGNPQMREAAALMREQLKTLVERGEYRSVKKRSAKRLSVRGRR